MNDLTDNTTKGVMMPQIVQKNFIINTVNINSRSYCIADISTSNNLKSYMNIFWKGTLARKVFEKLHLQ